MGPILALLRRSNAPSGESEEALVRAGLDGGRPHPSRDDMLGRMKIARVLNFASAALGAGLAVWAIVNAIFFDGRTGMTFFLAVLLWLATGFPLLVASALRSGVRLKGTSLAAPSHWADWKRESPFMSASGGTSRRERRARERSRRRR